LVELLSDENRPDASPRCRPWVNSAPKVDRPLDALLAKVDDPDLQSSILEAFAHMGPAAGARRAAPARNREERRFSGPPFCRC